MAIGWEEFWTKRPKAHKVHFRDVSRGKLFYTKQFEYPPDVLWEDHDPNGDGTYFQYSPPNFEERILPTDPERLQLLRYGPSRFGFGVDSLCLFCGHWLLLTFLPGAIGPEWTAELVSDQEAADLCVENGWEPPEELVGKSSVPAIDVPLPHPRAEYFQENADVVKPHEQKPQIVDPHSQCLTWRDIKGVAEALEVPEPNRRGFRLKIERMRGDGKTLINGRDFKEAGRAGRGAAYLYALDSEAIREVAQRYKTGG